MINNETIRVKDMYNYYDTKVSNSITAYKLSLEKLYASKTYFLGNLELCKEYIQHFTSIDYNGIAKLKNTIPNQYYNNNPIFKDLADKSKNLISFIVEINKRIEKEEKLLKEEELKKTTAKVYKRTIEVFNKNIANEILKGYTFQLSHRLANIRIKKHVRTEKSRKRIDWDASNKLKKSIIEQGLTPFKVTEYDSMKRPTADNGGVKWHVYHESLYSYTWHWNKILCKVFNSRMYRFRPTVNSNTGEGKYSLGNANRLQKLVKEDSELLKNYTT